MLNALLPSVLTVSSAAAGASGAAMSSAEAVLLGLVEGITEFLPISSTGHLLIAERLLDLGDGSVAQTDALNAYTVIIQLGAILAVLVVSWRRVLQILEGLIGRSAEGRRILVGLIGAFVPAAVVGLAFNDVIDKHLLQPVPVAIAWLVGAAAIFVLDKRYKSAERSGRPLGELTLRDAVIIGGSQAIALWPGTSRSLITILAAVFLGYSLSAAVEFSFLLGLATLGAASGYFLVRDAALVFDEFGTTAPITGMVFAFVSAVVAVKWMLAYLNTHDLRAFGAYRSLAGVTTLALVLVGTI